MLLEHLHHRPAPRNKKVKLMATCLCDSFFDEVAKATVEVLEYLGCEIEFPEAQTCCGQPAFNGGDWPASRKVVRHTMDVFAGEECIVVPSGSCAAMLFHGAPMEFEGEHDRERAEQLALRSWELTDYIYNGLGVRTWPGKFEARIAFHRSCHSRGTLSGPAARELFKSIAGLEVLPFGEDEQCCGFGGTFSVTFPYISGRMGEAKLGNIGDQRPDYLVSGDMGCLLHLGGIVDKARLGIPRLHIAEVLRNALRGGGLI
ncbi:MAG: (Fe-S)-binding protein [Verrucomicrobiae bacterium]|nr:(Fe-S)-binding protein [Verrucomicrobiae bacterium]